MRSLIFILSCLFLISCSTKQAPVDEYTKLIGLIWSDKEQKFIQPDELTSELAKVDYVLLGEKHDNEDQHHLQAYIVSALGGKGEAYTVGFEQIIFGNDSSDWKEWVLYEPILEAIQKYHLDILGLDIPSEKKREIADQGVAALRPSLVKELHLDKPVSVGILEELREDIRKGHCNEISDEQVEEMVQVQRTKDAMMAHHMISRAKKGIFIIGRSHARKDRGIPKTISFLKSEAKVLSLSFQEVLKDHTNSPNMHFDYIWFTKPETEDDYCKRFKKQLKSLERNLTKISIVTNIVFFNKYIF